MKDLVKSIEGKTNFSRRPKQFDGLTWLIRPLPPYFTADLRTDVKRNAIDLEILTIRHRPFA